jgi:hypothetical protein
VTSLPTSARTAIVPLRGTLYYLAALDTASPVEEKANRVFEEFLKGLQAE